MNWSKSILQKLEKEGKIKSVQFPQEPTNKIEIPKEIGPYKLHIMSVLEKSGLNFTAELEFSPDRKFRFDWAIPALKLAVEYEGIFSDKSGHTTVTGYSKDVIKYNLATKLGWKILRYTAKNYLDIEQDLIEIKILLNKGVFYSSFFDTFVSDMSYEIMITEIKSKILKTDLVRWKDLEFIQDDDFKEWIDHGDDKLIKSLMKYQFVDPFKVWENNGKIYCLDGKHRTIDLHELSLRGVEVPEELPAIFLDCENIEAAAELVLVYSSAYAKITQNGLFGFAEKFNLDLKKIETINFPELEMEFIPPPIPEVLTAPLKNNPPVIKISFANDKQMAKFEIKLKELLKDYDGSTYSISLGEM